MAISDNRQRIMPTMQDRLNGQPLAYPEAVLLTNPSDPELRGEFLITITIFTNLLHNE
ncbi:Rhamnogalacturonate lyase [Trema orientale]|uniref:Rhamnogalacturonate lyase n=1 Tax=Trema orientale TaxID=63057 RepID=A0A2P5ECD2_TREOI|nr:Rhamnogalacturonate lyase [Trema orientale]